MCIRDRAKIELSGVTSTNINLPYITADATGPKHLDLTLSRAKFDQLTAHLVEATAGPVRQAMGDAGLRPGVHLAGGVFLQKVAQTVCVVEVAVGEDSQVHLLEVYPQSLSILGKGLGTAGVQQDVMLPVLDVQGQAVFWGETAVLRGGVFYQDGYLHGKRSFHSMVWGRVRS